jgi:predicted phage tail component-like protein
MYNFSTLEGKSENKGSSFGLIFNGHDFEEVIPGFRTLAVSGRGLIGRNLEAPNVPGRDGSVLMESRLAPRDIGVKYVIEAESTDDLRRSYEKMNVLLNVELGTIKFKDDIQYHYKGSLSKATENDEVTNSVIGYLGFYCPAPFKYKEPVTVTGLNPSYELPEDYYGTKGDSAGLLADFSFKATATAPIVKLNNSLGQFIEIGPVTNGRTYQLILSGERVSVIENGMKKMSLLSITAGVESFVIKHGILYTLSTGGQLTAKFTEVRL